jgi:glycosyltransferase involved in cell wall biosynthesis
LRQCGRKGRRVRPSVSVVIPAYNHAAFLGEALESVFGQSVRPREVIAVDDGSTDDTAEVLRMYERRIRVLSQPNRGVAAARNAGAAVASGELLAFLDADDAWLPAKLERQVARFDGEPEIGLVHCGVAEVDGRGRQLRARLDGMEGWVSTEMLLFRRGVILGGGSAAVIRRAAFLDVGGFDEALSTSADWDLYYRVARRYPVGFVPEVLVRYRVHGGNMHRNVDAMTRDMLAAYAKVFSEQDPELQRLRRWAYGRLHAMLAGSFFQAGEYRRFARHAAASLAARPGQVGYFAGYPVRALRRCLSMPRVG